MAAEVVQLNALHRPPLMQSRQASGTIRYSEDTRWGELTGEGLTAVLMRAKRGDTADWAELCKFAERLFADLPTTRVDRVMQGEGVVRPPQGAETDPVAVFAAELIAKLLPRIEFFEDAQRKLLREALSIGFSAAEMDLQYDKRQQTYFCRSLMWAHPSRFAFDEQRVIRLHDRGLRSTRESQWGEQLTPHKWIVHYHEEIPDYRGATGIMIGCIWPWMLWRWVEKFWINGEERFGQPFVHGEVGPNAPPAVRAQLFEDLQKFISEHIAVVEQPTQIKLLEAATTTHEGKELYTKTKRAEIATKWLGASDITDPGVNGSQAAVSTRAGVTTDPRMVTDGKRFWETMRHSLFKALCHWNLHLFAAKFGAGITLEDITLPERALKTADDEVRVDEGKREQERVDDGEAADPVEPPDPKARAPEPPGQTSRSKLTSSPQARIRRTSTRSRSPFSKALRSE